MASHMSRLGSEFGPLMPGRSRGQGARSSLRGVAGQNVPIPGQIGLSGLDELKAGCPARLPDNIGPGLYPERRLRQHDAVGKLDIAQELDARVSIGTIYWEGLSELRDAQGRRIGLGYLEMTGYASRLRL